MTEKIITESFKKKEIPLAYFLIEKMKKSNAVSPMFFYKSSFYNTNFHKKTYIFHKLIH